MHRYLLSLTAAVAVFFAVGSSAQAQTAVFGFDDGVGVATAGTYNPGDSFTFSITLGFAPGGNMPNVDALSYWLEQQNPNAPFYFSITNRDNTGSTFTDLQTPHITYPQSLSPSNASDLGALTSDGGGRGAGAYFVAKITIQISPSAVPGSYQIESTTTGGKTSVAFDNTGTHSVPITPGIYTITIVPEPGTVALFASGIPMVFGFLRRRRG